ncbi:hypothetical protein CAAN1_09S03730 [[Candida] anglica]|uniref:Acyl-CoA thioesterase II n=1 Tax=[Candida] anglica TaxID=148631 RepID=A0ABP0EHV8_9ASCO
MATLTFEEAFRVVQVDESHYVGVHPLKLPLTGARGVYGGHVCAQTLLVALESAPGWVLHSLHSHFLGPANEKIVCQYEVTELQRGKNSLRSIIKVTQTTRDGTQKAVYTCMVSFVKKGINVQAIDGQRDPPNDIHYKYPDPDKLTVIHHTDFVKNAYGEELVDYRNCPEESLQTPSERWITLFSGIDQPESFSDPKFNYVGLGCISDSALLTTLARVLHLPWNPTEMFEEEEFDEGKDAKTLMGTSMNIIHLFHYHAMSLDHHIYFHCDKEEDSFDVVKQWLTFSYQMKTLRNGRTLVRGHFYNPNGTCVATIVQEGITLIHPDVAEKL